MTLYLSKVIHITQYNTGDTLEISFKRLRDAQQRLQTIVRKQFTIAAIQDDTASVERFFKVNKEVLVLVVVCDYLYM